MQTSRAAHFEPLESRKLFDGQLDTAFSVDGKVITGFGQTGGAAATDIVALPNGGAVAVGYTSFQNAVNGNFREYVAVAKYNASGSLDGAFSGDGLYNFNQSANLFVFDRATGVAVQGDGKILVSVQRISSGGNNGGGVLRLNLDGTPDQTFGGTGFVPCLTDISGCQVNSVDVDHEGRIYVTGTHGSDSAILRFTSTGSPDAEYGVNGMATVPRGTRTDITLTNARIDSSDRLVAVGSATVAGSENAVVVRLRKNGLMDADFGIGGFVDQPTYPRFADLSFAHNGKIFVGSTSTSSSSKAMLLNTDGSQVTAAGGEYSRVQAVGSLDDGKFLKVSDGGGSGSIFVSRLDSQLIFDSSYTQLQLDWSTTTSNYASASAISPTGRLYVAGYCNDAAGLPQFCVAAIVAGTNQAPEPVEGAFRYDASAQSVRIDFTEVVNSASVDVSDIELRRDGVLVSSAFSGASWTSADDFVMYNISPVLADGNYIATLKTQSVYDSASSAIQNLDAMTFEFFFLNGDANRDRKVDTQDFNILAANFGGTLRVFSQGNFNYDAAGKVDSLDFNLFLAQYGKKLALPASATPLMASGSLFAAAPDGDRDRDTIS